MRLTIEIATAALLIFCISATSAAFAKGVPGCRNSCFTKCQSIVPYEFPSMEACMAYWGPRNLAIIAEIRKARVRAGMPAR
jgi:hypothetical protein